MTKALIDSYHKQFEPTVKKIMLQLKAELDAGLGEANCKLYHGAPVWFVGENPVAGYSLNSRGVCLLFWNGQNFNSAKLHRVGKFFAAELRFHSVEEINPKELKSLIAKSRKLVWDSAQHIKDAKARSRS